MKRNERTSRKVASKAGAALRDPKSSKREKSVAASALTQREDFSFGPRMDDTLNRIGEYCRANGINHRNAARIFNAGLAAFVELKAKK